MQKKNFEQSVKDLLYDHQEKAPDLMGKVFEKRTPFYIFRNKLILNKYKLIAATLFVGVVIGYFGFISNSDTTQNTLSNQSNIKVNKVESIAKEVVKNDITNKVASKDVDITENEKSLEQEATFVKSEVNKPINEPINSKETKPNEIAKPNHVQSETTNSNNNQYTAAGATRTNEKLTQVPEENKPSVSQTSHENNDVDSNQPEITVSESKEKDITIEVGESTEKMAEDAVDVSSDDDLGGFDVPIVKPKKWSVSMTVGPAIGQRVLKSSSTDNGLIELRDNTEYQRASTMAEISLNYRLTDKWEGYFGVNSFNRHEKMEFSVENNDMWIDVSEKKVTEYHPVYGQREITIYDTVVRQKSTVLEGNSSNKYRHVSIPFGVRRNFYVPRFEKWSCYVSGQFGLEVVNQSKGNIITNSFETMQLGESFNRTSIGASAGFGAGISYLATKRISLIAEPRAMFFLNPTNNSSYTISQKDRGYGLMFGLKVGL